MSENKLRISDSILNIDEIRNFLELKPLISVDDDTISKINKSRQVIESILKSDDPVYGVNTGFGSFSETRIEQDTVAELQRRLVLSHAAGVGNPMPAPLVRLINSEDESERIEAD